MIRPVSRLNDLKSEDEELIKIISKSIDTAKKNNIKKAVNDLKIEC
jgi:hypothetical protein